MADKILSGDDVWEIISPFIGYWERDFGAFTNSEFDRGGTTRNGITLGYLKGLPKEIADLNKDGKVDLKDVLAADPEKAKKLFRFGMWEEGKSFCCPPLTAMSYTDFSVNSGWPRAVQKLQQAIDALRPGTIVKYAFNMGPKTKSALQTFNNPADDFDLAIKLIEKRNEYLKGIANKDASQARNLKGWLNRTAALQKLITEQHYNNTSLKYL